MANVNETGALSLGETKEEPHGGDSTEEPPAKTSRWGNMFGRGATTLQRASPNTPIDEYEQIKAKPEKWSMGVLNDRETEEVPGV